MDEYEKYHENEYEEDESLKDDVKPVGYFELFKFADKLDIFLMVIGMIFSLGNGVSIIFYSIPFGQLVDAFSGDKTSDQIVQAALKSVYGFLLNSAIVFVNSWFMSAAWMITSQRQMIKARKQYFQAILRQQIAWHDQNRATQICSRMYLQISKVHQALINNVTSVLTKVSMGSSGIIIALVRGWRMALVMVAFLPAMMLSGFISGYFYKKIEMYQQTKKVRQDSEVIEVFDNIKTIKMLDGEKHETERYEKNLKKAEQQTRSSGIKSAIAFAFFFFCIVMNYTLGFWYGSYLVSEKVINENSGKIYSVSDVVVIFFTLYISNISLSGLPQSLASFNVSRISMKKILLITQRRPKIIEGIKDIPHNIQKISFQNIRFQYQRPLFYNFDLKIGEGFTAIIGHSGCGKTTIISLLMRFYDVFQGQLNFTQAKSKKKINIKQFTFLSLRENIGYVGQEPVLIGKTIRQVLLEDDEENKIHTEKQIYQTLDVVKASGFVREIGLDTQYNQLSGGQKQRIAIARALLKKPIILILDESTSALDGKTEQQVLKGIKKMDISFVIMIAHRMQTLVHADRIIKLNKGKIQYAGGYEQMLKKGYIQQLQKMKDQQSYDVVEEKMQNNSEEEQSLIKEGQYKEKQQEEIPEEYDFKMSYFCQLLKMNKDYWYLYLIGFIGSFYFGCIFPAFSYLLSQIIALLSKISTVDDKDLPEYQQKVRTLSLALLFISIGALIFTLVKGVCFAFLNQKIGYLVKKNSFKKAVNKDMIQIQKVGAQRYSQIITINCEDLKPLAGNFLPHIIENSITIIVGLGIAFAFSWQITLVSFVIFPLILLSSKLQMSFNHGMQSNTDEVHKKNHQMVVNSVMYIRTVKSLGIEKRIVNKYGKSLDQALKLAVKYGNLVGILFGIGQTLISCLLALIFFIGALLIKAKAVEVVDVYTAIYAIMFAGVQAGGNLFFLTKLSVAKFGTCKYFELLGSQNEENDRENEIIESDSEELEESCTLNGKVELKQISFRYESRDYTVFDNFNLKIKEGEKIALVGASGSGKSTITNLLFRIYEPQSGDIIFDENNIKDIPIRKLRRQIGIVSQQPALFNRSISQNIKYNKRNVSMNDIVQASKIANAYEFIMQGNFGRKNDEETDETQEKQQKLQQRQGFDKLAGLKGSFLSGGQKQRIAIARALVRKPKILVLDEATSALDVKSEKIIQESLQNMKNITQIIIAHRLSTIKNCDRIYVLEKGKIVEAGKYTQLIEKNGHFAKLVSSIKNN